MGVLDVTTRTFDPIINDDLYDFLPVQHVRAANNRNVLNAQNIVLNRIKNSHSLKPDYILDLIYSWFPKDDFCAIINTFPMDERKEMTIEVQRKRTMTQCSMHGPAGTVFEIRIDKKVD